MKKINLLSLVFIVLLAVTSCSKKSEYMNALPKDAKVVVAIDGKSIAKKAAIQGENGAKLQEKFLQILGKSMDGEDFKSLEKIIKNPSELGVSLIDRIFLFSTNLDRGGVVMKVTDEGKLKDFMKILAHQFGGNLKESDGCTFLVDDDYIFGTNGSAFMGMMGTRTLDENMKYMSGLMKQDEADSYASSNNFNRLLKQEGEVTAMMDMSMLSRMQMGFLDGAKLEDIKVVSGLIFEKGKVLLNGEMFTENAELQKQMQADKKNYNRIDGRFAKCLPSETLAFFAMNINGDEMSKQMSGNTILTNLIQGYGLDTDMLKSVKGEFSGGLMSVSLNNGVQDFTLMAEAKDNSTIESFKKEYDITGMIKSTGKDEYAFPFGEKGNMGYFGYKKGVMYLTNRSVVAQKIGESVKGNLTDAPWYGRMKKSVVFVALNTNAAMSSPSIRTMMSQSSKWAQVAMALQDVSYIDVSIDEDDKYSMEMVMKDGTINVLEKLVKMLANL